MDTPWVPHVPTQPIQHHHTATCTYTSTSTHRSPGKAHAHARCPNPHPRSHYLQDPASYARPGRPGPSAVPHGPLLGLGLHNLHQHNHLIHHHHHVLIRHSSPQTAVETSQTGSETRPQPEQPRRRQGPRPDEARARSPAEIQDRRQAAAQTRRRAAAATRSQTKAQAQARRHNGSARPTPRGCPLWHSALARRQQRPAGRPPTVTDANATTLMAEHAGAEARRNSSRHLSKPAPQAHGLLLTGPERRQGPPAAPLPPYEPSMSAHIQRMPRYRRRRESQPNPEAETVRTYPRVHICSRPHSPGTPTAQDYEESLRPATATSPHDPVTPTHAHSSAQDRGPAQGQ